MALQDIGVRAVIENLQGYLSGQQQMERATSQTAAGIQRSADNANRSLTSMLHNLTGISGSFINILAGAGIGFGLKAIIDTVSQSEQVTAQLNATLKSTAGISGVTADAAQGLATQMSRLGTADDEAVLSAENLLLTFTNIHANVFPATTQAVLDMSQAMGQDLQSTALQVGKALQDPIEGVTALQRVGVRLSESQKDVITQMVKMGDVAGAQTIILKELQTEFGGSAEAAGKTAAGAFAHFRTELGNVVEVIGANVLPAFAVLAQGAADVLPTAFRQSQVSLEQLRAIFLIKVADMLDASSGFAGQVVDDADTIGKALKGIADVAGPPLNRLWTEFIQNEVFWAQRTVQIVSDVGEFLGKQIASWRMTLEGPRIIGPLLSEIQAPGFIGPVMPTRGEETTSTLKKLSDIFREAARAQIDAANAAAAETGAQIDLAKAFADGQRNAGPYTKMVEDAGNATGALGKTLKETVPTLLDMSGLLDKAFPREGVEAFRERITHGFDIITPDVEAVLEDWGRQVSEFQADLSTLLGEIRAEGSLTDQETIQHVNAIFAAIGALPPELQKLFSDSQSTFTDLLKQFGFTLDGLIDLTRLNHDTLLAQEKEAAETRREIQKSATDAYLENLRHENDEILRLIKERTDNELTAYRHLNEDLLAQGNAVAQENLRIAREAEEQQKEALAHPEVRVLRMLEASQINIGAASEMLRAIVAAGGKLLQRYIEQFLEQFPGIVIPAFQHGGLMAYSGLALVGERGPEVVSLPVGARVTPITHSTSFNVNANYTRVQEPQSLRLDLEAIAMMMAR